MNHNELCHKNKQERRCWYCMRIHVEAKWIVNLPFLKYFRLFDFCDEIDLTSGLSDENLDKGKQFEWTRICFVVVMVRAS